MRQQQYLTGSCWVKVSMSDTWQWPCCMCVLWWSRLENPQGIQYYTRWSEHMKHSDKPLHWTSSTWMKVSNLNYYTNITHLYLLVGWSIWTSKFSEPFWTQGIKVVKYFNQGLHYLSIIIYYYYSIPTCWFNFYGLYIV